MDFTSLLGGFGGGGGAPTSKEFGSSTATTNISYGSKDPLPPWVIVAVLAGAGLLAFVAMLAVLRKL